MEKKRNIVLVLGTVVLLVGMNFATMPIGANGNGNGVLAPSVTKGVSPEDICFGSINTKTTVTIEVNGNGGTSTTIIPMDVIFAIDSSGSMAWVGHDPLKLRLAAAKYFVNQMDNTRDKGGVVSWDGGIDFTYPVSPPGGVTDDFVTLKDQIDLVDSSGGTDLNVGLGAAIAMLDANTRTDPSSEVIIFLTDGLGAYTYYLDGLGDPNPASPTYIAASQGYVIYSIGLGSSASSAPLEDMAFYTGGAYYDAPTAENLDAIFNAIYEVIVTSNVPHYVKVIEVTESYIVGHGNFNHAPDSITTNLDGTTTIIWENIGQYTTDGDAALDADETVTLTFDVGADKPGYHMDVQVEGEAIVEYSDVDVNYVGFVDIPQATINVAYSTDMIADGGDEYIDVGDIVIWQDDEYLYVKYVTDDGWEMTETHLHVVDAGDTEDTFPVTKKGNPKIGKFEYSGDHSPAVTEVTYMIEWTWASDALLYIAAHAVVQIEIESLTEYTEYRIETAWGEGEDFGGSSWAMYIEYEDP